MVNIQIGSEFLDLFPNELIAISYQASDLTNVSNLAGSFTNSFSVPATYDNIRRLGYASNPLLARNIFKRINASLLQEQTVVSFGYIRVTFFNKKDGIIDIEFFGNQTNIFEILGDKVIGDVNLSYLDHTYNSATINSLVNAQSGIIYTPINYGLFDSKQDTTIKVGEIFPSIFVKNIVVQMLQDAGYKLEGNITDSVIFQKMVIPYIGSFNEGQFVRNKAKSFSAKGRYLNYIINGFDPPEKILLLEQNEEFNQDNLFDLTTSTYTADGSYNVAFLATFSGDVSFSGADIQLWKNGVYYKSFGVGYLQALEQVTNGDYFEFYIDVTAPFVGNDVTFYFQAIKKTSFSNGYTIEANGLLPDVTQSDLLKYVCVVTGSQFTVNEFSKTVIINRIDSIKNNYANAYLWDDKIDQSQPIDIDYTSIVDNYGKENLWSYLEDDNDLLTDAYFQANGQTYGSGTIDIDNDFAEAQADIYEAPFAGTKSKTTFNTVELFLPFIPLLETQGTVSGQHFTSSPVENEFTIEFASPRSNVKSVIVFNSSPATYDGTYECEQIDDITVKITTAGTFAGGTMDVIPLIGVGEPEPRVLLIANSITVFEINNTNTNALTIGATSNTLIGYPYFYKDRLAQTLDTHIDNLTFSRPLDSTIPDLGTLQNNYSIVNQILNNPITITAYFNLKSSDIVTLDYLKPVYLSEFQSYFMISKIEDFNASGESTLVELVKI